MTRPPASHPGTRRDPATGRPDGGRSRRPAPVPAGPPQVADLQLRGVTGPVRARVHWPAHGGHGPRPALLVHFPAEPSAAGATSMAAELCRRVGVVVLSAFPRPAGAGPVPTEGADAMAALDWAADHAAELDADPRRLLVAGEGAGGRLAAAVAVHARDQRWPSLVHQLLVHPELGTGPAGPPSTLAGVAPATVVTAGDDPAVAGGRRYAAWLRHAGVRVEERRYDRRPDADALVSDLSHVLRHTLAALPRPRGPT